MSRNSYRGKRKAPRQTFTEQYADTQQNAPYGLQHRLLSEVRTLAGVRVFELVPGDLVNLGPFTSTFVQQAPHPIWPHLKLVIWKTPPELGLPGDWSHDALDPAQVVGTRRTLTPEQRAHALRAALTPGSTS